MRRTLNALTTKLAGRVKPFLNIPTALMMALAVGGFGLSLWMVDDAIEGSMLLAGPGIHNDCAIDAEPYLSTTVVASPGYARAEITPYLNGRSPWAGGFGNGDEESFHGAGHVNAYAGFGFYDNVDKPDHPSRDTDNKNGSVLIGFQHNETPIKLTITEEEWDESGLVVGVATAVEIAGEFLDSIEGMFSTESINQTHIKKGRKKVKAYEITLTLKERQGYKESLKAVAEVPVCPCIMKLVERGMSYAHAHITDAGDFHVTCGDEDVTAIWKLNP
ncbi:MAG: hypothetical protein OXT69_13200 [Candidatus Poribacteria bacterium]|nr:hypothetical protein [Candidatus Poribacteria bacterium]